MPFIWKRKILQDEHILQSDCASLMISGFVHCNCHLGCICLALEANLLLQRRFAKNKKVKSDFAQKFGIDVNFHLLICAIYAVLISITDPLLHQTLLTLGAAVFSGADHCGHAALLVRAIPAVWVTVTMHRGRHTLATGAPKISGAAFLFRCRERLQRS